VLLFSFLISCFSVISVHQVSVSGTIALFSRIVFVTFSLPVFRVYGKLCLNMDFSNFGTNHLFTVVACALLLGAQSTKKFTDSDIEHYRLTWTSVTRRLWIESDVERVDVFRLTLRFFDGVRRRNIFIQFRLKIFRRCVGIFSRLFLCCFFIYSSKFMLIFLQ